MAANGSIVCDRDRALAFRLDRHHLARRLPPGSLLEAAGACGIQDTPPGSAALALHARVTGLTPADVDRALAADKTVLQAMSLRGAPLVFPTADAAIFTAGLLPEDEPSLRFFIAGAGEGLDRVGMSAIELTALTAGALPDILASREMTKDELGLEIADRISERLDTGRREQWRLPSWYASGQYLGESLVRFALYVVSLQGLFCYGPRKGNKARFVLTGEWLDSPLPVPDSARARAGLARRYLHCYGPSTPAHYAEWAGIAPAQADRAWSMINGELTEVDFTGQRAWILGSDVACIKSPAPASGVRFLPPHEPLLQMRDRATLVPDQSLHRKLWRAVGNPGLLLVDGEAVAAWRSQKNGRTMNLAIETFADIPGNRRPEIAAEAATLAPYRGCSSVNVRYGTI
ncbi:MAG: hypothetical protein A4E28_01528 [Methanocella sp. PtaU1.Bin125]|nr:MAG: hypothetical protein A4E28_01528 [Methanocella sp. PtaU1.Bin125]